MYFLKKNIPLLCFFVVTVVIVLTMTVLDVRLYFKYRDAKKETEQNVKKIQEITKKKPAPLNENVKAIEKDTLIMMEKKKELQRMFGKIHRNALQKFAKTIGMTEDVLIEDFAAYYNELPAEKQGSVTGENDKEILDNFFKLLYYPRDENDELVDTPEDQLKLNIQQQTMKKQIEQACLDFENYASERFLEYDNNGYKYLLEALGLPRTELASTFKRQLTQVNEKILSNGLVPGLDEFGESKVSASSSANRSYGAGSLSRTSNTRNSNTRSPGRSSGADKSSGVSYYTFKLEDLPLQRETYLACRQLQIRLDMYSRMKKAKLESVPVVEDYTGLEGKPMESDAFLSYTYKIEVEGNMDSIRNFLNYLTDGYKDYMVYSIRDVQLERSNPEDFTKLSERSDSAMIRDKDGRLSESYGRTVVGNDTNIRCTILVDYIMYVEDLLQRQSPEQN